MTFNNRNCFIRVQITVRVCERVLEYKDTRAKNILKHVYLFIITRVYPILIQNSDYL